MIFESIFIVQQLSIKQEESQLHVCEWILHKVLYT